MIQRLKVHTASVLIPGSSQSPVTPAPGDVTPLPVFCRYVHMLTYNNYYYIFFYRKQQRWLRMEHPWKKSWAGHFAPCGMCWYFFLDEYGSPHAHRDASHKASRLENRLRSLTVAVCSRAVRTLQKRLHGCCCGSLGLQPKLSWLPTANREAAERRQ